MIDFKKFVSIIPLIVGGGWFYQIFYFTNHFFEKAYTDQFSLLLLFVAVYLFGSRVLHKFRLSHSLAAVIVFIISAISLPLTYLLVIKSNYSTLPLYSGVLLSALVLSSKGYQIKQLIIGITIGFVVSFFIDQSIILFGALTLLVFIFSPESRLLRVSGSLVVVLLIYMSPTSNVEYFETQKSYFDRVISADSTRFQNIDITEWKNKRWFYSNRKNQFSTFDYFMYYEPFVHPAMQIASQNSQILIIGSENGILASELLKYPKSSITIVPIDAELTELVKANKLYDEVNNNSLDNSRISLVNEPAFDFLASCSNCWDLIFIDTPDPTDIETNQYFTREFYELAKNSVKDNGLIVNQSLSPYLSPNSFEIIQQTLRSAGLYSVPLHNQVPTLGEWSWVISTPNANISIYNLISSLNSISVETRWLNPESLKLITSFGKRNAPNNTLNSIQNPILYQVFNFEISRL